jgi:hypothetical protein
MFRPKMQVLLLATAVIFLAAGVSIYFMIKYNTLDRSRMEKVKVGMTYDQVCQVVKCHPGDYSDGCNFPCGHTRASLWHYNKRNHWICNEGDLSVLFDENGVAIEVMIYPVFRSYEPSTIEEFRKKLGI